MAEASYFNLTLEEMGLQPGQSIERYGHEYLITDIYHSGRIHRAQCTMVARSEPVLEAPAPAIEKFPLEPKRRKRFQRSLDEAQAISDEWTTDTPYIPWPRRLRRDSIWRGVDPASIPGTGQYLEAQRKKALAAGRARVLSRHRRRKVPSS